MNTWFLNKMISLKFSADGTNGIFRGYSKKFGTGQTGSGQFRIFRGGTNGIRDYSEFFGTGHSGFGIRKSLSRRTLGGTGSTVTSVAGEPVTGGPVIHRHRCMPNRSLHLFNLG